MAAMQLCAVLVWFIVLVLMTFYGLVWLLFGALKLYV
jgi:hypothetical protein